ncbi:MULTISPECIES: sigma-54 dependent transcriptional regulator [unclassified Burkholderia]|uniref:sigma-54 dependent transcriptional regulator n=1 Tax=unclassified Burkholderia TaxID=2613784 RepID=UPI001D103B6C|nr:MULTISPECIES: sigma-54 dependent transcriptional regulator [unclassified Burkholderia]
MSNTERRRRLVYWTNYPETVLIDGFSRRGWSVSIARDGDLGVSTNNAVRGGVLDLGGRDIHELEATYLKCAAWRNVAWVALIDKHQSEMEIVRDIIRNYCFDYISLPMQAGRIVDAVGHAYGMESLLAANQPIRFASKLGMIGESDVMLKLYEKLRRVARTDAPVHIFGETGTGKELSAAAIHQNSARSSGPLVALNCGAIPSHLLQSELFGYERGAFTGASARKKGYIESANGGTLLLDEIGDLPLESQASLLRFLQEGTIFRLGSSVPVQVDVRIITATHVDLHRASLEGRFRADLYHRLCVLRVDQPPLRARGKDIERLARHAIEQFKGDCHGRVCGLSADAIAALHRYEWPGNVRELINRIRRALVMTNRRFITAQDLEIETRVDLNVKKPVSEIHESIMRHVIKNGLLDNRGCVARTARELGMSRATLYRWMKLYNIERVA